MKVSQEQEIVLVVIKIILDELVLPLALARMVHATLVQTMMEHVYQVLDVAMELME